MGKEVKEIRLGAEGLKTYLEVQGEEVKITKGGLSLSRKS